MLDVFEKVEAPDELSRGRAGSSRGADAGKTLHRVKMCEETRSPRVSRVVLRSTRWWSGRVSVPPRKKKKRKEDRLAVKILGGEHGRKSDGTTGDGRVVAQFVVDHPGGRT